MSAIEYRPSIDGIRAIAVVSVLLFHLDPKILPGGFVGVDIFFVISGYLITAIIQADIELDRFSLLRFYQRRVARIFPVFFFVSLAILIAASIFYTPQDFASAGALAAASSLSITNIKLMLQGNYFEISADAQPFLHFWSLSVEEQFYFFLPVTLFVASKFRVSKKWLMSLLSATAIISFVFCVYLTAVRPVWAFYLLPTRAWELLAGSMLALTATRNRQAQDTVHSVESWLSLFGLALILLSLLMISEQSPFPGYVAALPVIGTLLLIGRSHHSQQITESLLSQPALVFVGKISYSLYLWHWPIYCFTDYGFYSEPLAVRTAAKVGLTLLLSLASYFFLENPARRYLNQPRHTLMAFAGLAVSVAAFSVVGIHIRSSNYINASQRSVSAGGITVNKTISKPVIVLMGDSNGSMYGLAMKDIAEKLNVRLQVISVAAGNPFPPSQLYKDSIQFLANEKPFITIFVAAWGEKIAEKPEALRNAVEDILRNSEHVILVTQPPRLPQNASREWIRDHGRGPIFEDAECTTRRKIVNEFLSSLDDDRVHVIDVEPMLFANDGQINFEDGFGRQIYHDKLHLSGFGAEIVGKQLARKISDLLQTITPESSARGHQAERSSKEQVLMTDR